MTTRRPPKTHVALAAIALCACRGSNDGVASGFTDSASDDGGPGAMVTSAEDGGEPAAPTEDPELCDGGDEAWAKRVLPLIQGRRPEGVREVRILVQMVQQLNAMGRNGRHEVALGLARGPLYRARWKQYLYDQLRVNVSSDRRNEDCYDVVGDAAEDTALAEHVRDNGPTEAFDGGFRFADVVYSALRLDDVTPAYRADLFARLSAPTIAGNVTPEELESMNRTNYGQAFEAAYLGRKTECLPCHRAEMAVTNADDPELDRHWPLAGNFELAVYGPDAGDANDIRAHAIFRRAGFGDGGPDRAWGMDPICGTFDFGADDGSDILDQVPHLVGDYSDDVPPNGRGATVYHLESRMRAGFDALVADGLDLASDGTVNNPYAGFAYLFSMNFANKLWREAMGYPLTVANNFPRNGAQRDTLEQLTDAFVDQRYSLRYLLAEVATHPYFNQQTPDTCETSTPYPLPAVFDPFTKSSSNPLMRGNGVGDTLHRHSARVLIDSTAQAMWWPRSQAFGPAHEPNEIPGTNCGMGTFPPCTEEPAQIGLLRDMGVFLNDSESGFNGVDFNGLLRWETTLAPGMDPGLGGDCTGPLAGGCADADWITQLLDAAYADGDATIADVAAAVKDRLLTEPILANDAERNALGDLMGLDLDAAVGTLDRGTVDTATRRVVGMLVNTPQYLLAGVVSADQDPANDPRLVVAGTSTSALCNVLGELVLGSSESWSCSGDGISIGD